MLRECWRIRAWDSGCSAISFYSRRHHNTAHNSPAAKCIPSNNRTDSSDVVLEAAEANNTAALLLDEAVRSSSPSIQWVPPRFELYWRESCSLDVRCQSIE